jgi:hypothetical protein
MVSDKIAEPISAVEIERLVRDHLSGAAWASVLAERIVIRKLGRWWMVHLAADRAGGPWIYADSRGRVRHVDFTSPAQRLLRIVAFLVLLAGLTLLVAHIYPRQWCGTEVTASGVKRNICRDPEVTDPGIVALGLVILAALGVFYTEISGFGLTFRRQVNEADTNARESLSQISELQAVRKSIQETQEDFAEANSQTDGRLTRLEHAVREIRDQLDRVESEGNSNLEDDIREHLDSVVQTELGPPTTRRGSPDVGSTMADGDGPGQADLLEDVLSGDEVRRYAAEYDRCRSTMVAGADRSARMEEIFSDMRSAVKGSQVPIGGVERGLLSSNDRGIRLTAYAYLIERPDPDLLTSLVNGAATEDKPFGQYCALRAVNRLVKTSNAKLAPELITRLNEVAIKAGPGTDRAREVASILAEDRRKPPPSTV